jgi:hypothetical protein
MQQDASIQPLAADKPYKWIRQEIERSDPYTEYEKISRLSMEYAGDSAFMNNTMYALTFSNFIPNEWGSEVVWRHDGGRVLHSPTDRMYETLLHNSTWWFHGPRHLKTLESIAIINKRHQYRAKQYPGAFAHPIDYTYVLCFSAVLNHRLRLRLGLSGFNSKQKIAAQLCLKEFTHLFLVEQPGQPEKEWAPLSTVAAFPDDFDGVIAFCEDVENNHMHVTDAGHMVAEALFDHFAYVHFPPCLRHLGRAVPIALSLPQLLAAHRIKPVSPVLAQIIIFVIGTFIWFMETFMPDPKIAARELMEQKIGTSKVEDREARRTADKGFPRVFEGNHRGAAALCPFRVNEKSA